MSSADLATHVLRQADRALVLAHRLGQWITHAPELEEDLALANISLDLLGQARYLYPYAAELDGSGRAEDDYAFWRDAADFRNPIIVEQLNGDFACSIVRQYLHDVAALLYWESMIASRDETLAAIAARAGNETAFHLRHSRGWVLRLGDGTEESHRRAQAAVEQLWPWVDELFGADDEDDLRESGLLGPRIEDEWRARVASTLTAATLGVPAVGSNNGRGLHGEHSSHLAGLLAEMQSLPRLHPGATW